MPLSILDLYILSLIDRGLSSRYELQRRVGLSLGSSIPALRRLEKAKLVVQHIGTSTGKRPRHELKLSAAGRRAARTGWRRYLSGPDHSIDLDSILRLVDMADHYGAAHSEIAQFLKAMSARHGEADPGTANLDWAGREHKILEMRERWAAIRKDAEAQFLTDLAAGYAGPRKWAVSRKRSPARSSTRTP